MVTPTRTRRVATLALGLVTLALFVVSTALVVTGTTHGGGVRLVRGLVLVWAVLVVGHLTADGFNLVRRVVGWIGARPAHEVPDTGPQK